jgi:hypothetical protein
VQKDLRFLRTLTEVVPCTSRVQVPVFLDQYGILDHWKLGTLHILGELSLWWFESMLGGQVRSGILRHAEVRIRTQRARAMQLLGKLHCRRPAGENHFATGSS